MSSKIIHTPKGKVYLFFNGLKRVLSVPSTFSGRDLVKLRKSLNY